MFHLREVVTQIGFHPSKIGQILMGATCGSIEDEIAGNTLKTVGKKDE
jgi:hypothetical protein